MVYISTYTVRLGQPDIYMTDKQRVKYVGEVNPCAIGQHLLVTENICHVLPGC